MACAAKTLGFSGIHRRGLSGTAARHRLGCAKLPLSAVCSNFSEAPAANTADHDLAAGQQRAGQWGLVDMAQGCGLKLEARRWQAACPARCWQPAEYCEQAGA